MYWSIESSLLVDARRIVAPSSDAAAEQARGEAEAISIDCVMSLPATFTSVYSMMTS